MTAQQLLSATATFIEQNGLSRSGARDAHGRVCTVVALGIIGGRSNRLVDQALDIINDHLGHHVGIGQWSDASPPEVVVATLRRLASTTPHERELDA